MDENCCNKKYMTLMIRKKREMPRSLYDVRRQPHTDGLAPPTYATSDDVARTNQISKNTPVSQIYRQNR